MNETIEVEADSLEEAREQVRSQIPEGFSLLSEEIISDGLPTTVEVVADTLDEALEKAQAALPDGAHILGQRELAVPERIAITVEAFTETGARMEADHRLGAGKAVVKSVRMTAAGSRGFLGFGKTPNRYEVEVVRRAVLEITYRTKARISAQAGRTPPDPQKELERLREQILYEGVRAQMSHTNQFFNVYNWYNHPDRDEQARQHYQRARDSVSLLRHQQDIAFALARNKDHRKHTGLYVVYLVGTYSNGYNDERVYPVLNEFFKAAGCPDYQEFHSAHLERVPLTVDNMKETLLASGMEIVEGPTIVRFK